jgi:hypothetical protein
VEEEEIEVEGEGDNLLVLNSLVNGNNAQLISCDQYDLLLNDKEGNKDNSNVSLNVPFKENLNSVEGDVLEDGGINLEDRVEESGGIELGRGAGVGGPILSINSDHAVKGGASSKEILSVDLGRSLKPTKKQGEVEQSLEVRKGGVYSNGPSGVYKLLNNNPPHVASSSFNQCLLSKKGKATFPTIPPSASLRRQQLMAKSLAVRNSHSHSTNVSVTSIHNQSNSRSFRGEAENDPSLVAGVTRGPVEDNQSNSSEAQVSKLGCSSINSTDIRNCNNRF